MKISELETHLAEFRGRLGDVEIWEALPEYGERELTDESIKKFLRIVVHTYPKENRSEDFLVIGCHHG